MLDRFIFVLKERPTGKDSSHLFLIDICPILRKPNSSK